MHNKGYTYTDRVTADASGERLADFYAERYIHSSREEWVSRIAQGIVLRNGRPAHPNDVLVVGDDLSYCRPPWEEPPTPCTFAVLFRDEHLIAVAKPSGLPVLPGGEHLENTLLSAVRRHFSDAPDPVHRLGRGTSGIVLFARTPLARRSLSEDVHKRRVTKIYRAIVSGTDLPAAFTVDTPIGRVPYPEIGYLHAATPDGKPSQSECRLLHSDLKRDQSIIEIDLITGRPHQIRIHMAAAGHPLVGDPLYTVGGLPIDPIQGRRLPLPGDVGYHLHAHKITFSHPATREHIHIECHPPPSLRLCNL